MEEIDGVKVYKDTEYDEKEAKLKKKGLQPLLEELLGLMVLEDVRIQKIKGKLGLIPGDGQLLRDLVGATEYRAGLRKARDLVKYHLKGVRV